MHSDPKHVAWISESVKTITLIKMLANELNKVTVKMQNFKKKLQTDKDTGLMNESVMTYSHILCFNDIMNCTVYQHKIFVK